MPARAQRFPFRLMREAYFSGKSPPDRAPIASGPSPLQKAQRCDTFTGGDSAQCRRTNKETIGGRNNTLYLIAKDVDDPAQHIALLDCLSEFHFGDEKPAMAGA